MCASRNHLIRLADQFICRDSSKATPDAIRAVARIATQWCWLAKITAIYLRGDEPNRAITESAVHSTAHMIRSGGEVAISQVVSIAMISIHVTRRQDRI